MKCGSIMVLAGLITLVSVSAAPAWDYFSVGVSYNAPVVVERVYAPPVVYTAPVVYETPVVYAPVTRAVVYDAPVYVAPRPFFNFTYIGGGHGHHRNYYCAPRSCYRGGGARVRVHR
jgi:hypothetical protein